MKFLFFFLTKKICDKVAILQNSQFKMSDYWMYICDINHFTTPIIIFQTRDFYKNLNITQEKCFQQFFYFFIILEVVVVGIHNFTI